MFDKESIHAYIGEIARQFATGAATEHSYRPALQRLLSAAIPRATVVNEPARIECGAPDFLVRENGPARRPVGYVEAKDIGDGDLDGNGAHREQFDRYKAELSNIVFTDYLDFHFYEEGEFVAKCRVAEVAGSRIVPAAPEELERFAGLLRHFAEVAPRRITSPSRLAQLMAGKARLLARAVAATLGKCASVANCHFPIANEGVVDNCQLGTGNTGNTGNISSPLAQQFLAFRQWLVHDLDAASFADVYAQTIVYGMFAARFHDKTPEDFSRAEAASLVPRSNPLLRRLFRDLDEYMDESVVWIIDDLVALFAASDVAAIMASYSPGTRGACPYPAQDGRVARPARPPDGTKTVPPEDEAAAGRVARPARPPDRDPLLHFYEDFLAAYNPGLRKQRGVWYTPAPVVGFIVRSVDAVLRRDFALPAGLADASKTRVKVVNDNRARKGDAKFVEREMHRVQILDPAMGTGTFIAEVVRLVRSKFAGQEGLWPGYVRDHLLPRLNGFEILMASYAMAHLKLDMLLSEDAESASVASVANSQLPMTNERHGSTGNWQLGTGNNSTLATFSGSQRLRLFLTNSLEEFSETTGTLWAMELSNEAREADFIKRDCPVMVVMGNPPYSVSSSNKSEWIQRLVADYKAGLGEKKINLDDDYIKFIRLGQHYIDRNGEGILAYISNNSFLDGITHRQMRKSLMESFDEIYILDLHGNARKKETSPDGGKDENVFDIMQGVSINIFVKRKRPAVTGGTSGAVGTGLTGGTSATGTGASRLSRKSQSPVIPLARVFHAELFGEREAKYAFLDAHDLATVEYRELSPQAPYYFFVPKDFALQAEYEKGFSIAELMPVNNSGIQTKRDKLVYQFAQNDIDAVVRNFRNEDAESLRKRYSLPKDGRDWAVAWAKEDALKGDGAVTQILYHPFDKRWTFFSGQSSGFMAYPRMPQSSHLLHDNIALLLVRNTRRENPYNFFVSDTIVDKDGVSGFDNCRFFPLWLYSENMGKVERAPNLNSEIVRRIEAAVAGTSGMDAPSRSSQLSRSSLLPPEDIFHYIYAVLHTPSYRSRYKEFLKVDFPRIPYPSSGEEFRELAAVGERLVQVHLLKDPEVCDMFSPCATFPVAGDNNVANVKMLPMANSNVQLETGNTGIGNTGNIGNNPTCRVFINSSQYFDNVPAEAWEFYVGGYQPAQKWLKDRKGRALATDDIFHYKKLILALVATSRLMKELSIIAERNGG